ncbi:hypothetical protein HJC23_000613 [Cyclotella cryptica]|uniref:Uncharacterized protein n=1 Tax=Cyclotella cryptica TaxID=29204 RepID=A0ABD3QD59_9STRA|eukprot:CCRYP_007994-RA/>CCRYP_007994-RA protein AED:0.02 eAED:0.02 QI:115/1/1/1/1/1/2/1818/472
MTDDTSSSPSKYDGYSAYLQSLSRSTINAIAQRQEQQQQQDERARDFSTPQKPPQRSNSRHEHDDDHDDSGSPPYTPSTPPPPPPLPAGTALSPRFGSLSPVGSFAEAVRPLASNASGESGDDDERGVDTAKHEAHRQTPQDQERDRNDDGAASSDASSSDAPHWEDFMAHYWKLPSDNALQIHAHAASIVQAEDVDLRPCPTEPQLDDEPFLSPIRTGCIDIDMDANTVLKSPSSSADAMDTDPRELSSPMKELSHVGLESARIMAKLHGGEIREDAVSIATPVNASADVSYRRQTSHERFAAPSLSSSVSSLVPLSSPHSFDDRRSVASNTNTNHSTSSEPNHALPTTSSQEWPHKISPLPSKTLIHSLGPILTRTSLRSLVLKKWSPAYWMHYGPHTLLLFRTMEQLDDWRYNPYHGKRQREFLIKLRIDFYGEMVAGETREGGGGSGVLGHRILPVKRKSYGKNEMDM